MWALRLLILGRVCAVRDGSEISCEECENLCGPGECLQSRNHTSECSGQGECPNTLGVSERLLAKSFHHPTYWKDTTGTLPAGGSEDIPASNAMRGASLGATLVGCWEGDTTPVAAPPGPRLSPPSHCQG